MSRGVRIGDALPLFAVVDAHCQDAPPSSTGNRPGEGE